MKTSFDNSSLRRAARGPVVRSVIAGCVFAGVAMTFAPLSAHAQNAPIVTKDRPFDAYPSTYSSNPIRSWLDMVSASQAAQPSWMTPLVTVTPRLEQEFRWDVYDQKNGTGTQGNGQRLVNYGGPGGARVELIPAYNWEVILAPPPYVTASGPKGTGQGTGDWPMFLVKYRLLSANKDNGDYIVTAFFQMSDPSGTCCTISNNVLVAQPTLAFGKGWGDFDIQSTISTQYPGRFDWSEAKDRHDPRKFRRPGCLRIQRFNITFCSIFGRNWRSTTPTGPTERMPAGTRSCSRPASFSGASRSPTTPRPGRST